MNRVELELVRIVMTFNVALRNPKVDSFQLIFNKRTMNWAEVSKNWLFFIAFNKYISAFLFGPVINDSYIVKNGDPIFLLIKFFKNYEWYFDVKKMTSLIKQEVYVNKQPTDIDYELDTLNGYEHKEWFKYTYGNIISDHLQTYDMIGKYVSRDISKIPSSQLLTMRATDSLLNWLLKMPRSSSNNLMNLNNQGIQGEIVYPANESENDENNGNNENTDNNNNNMNNNNNNNNNSSSTVVNAPALDYSNLEQQQDSFNTKTAGGVLDTEIENEDQEEDNDIDMDNDSVNGKQKQNENKSNSQVGPESQSNDNEQIIDNNEDNNNEENIDVNKEEGEISENLSQDKESFEDVIESSQQASEVKEKNASSHSNKQDNVEEQNKDMKDKNDKKDKTDKKDNKSSRDKKDTKDKKDKKEKSSKNNRNDKNDKYHRRDRDGGGGGGSSHSGSSHGSRDGGHSSHSNHSSHDRHRSSSHSKSGNRQNRGSHGKNKSGAKGSSGSKGSSGGKGSSGRNSSRSGSNTNRNNQGYECGTLENSSQNNDLYYDSPHASNMNKYNIMGEPHPDLMLTTFPSKKDYHSRLRVIKSEKYPNQWFFYDPVTQKIGGTQWLQTDVEPPTKKRRLNK